MAIAPTSVRREPAPARDMVMISHANPEDDDLTIWLATQLASAGYKVWCDKAQLLAGEQFWSDIDHVIRERAYKVIYVLSRVSNELGLRGFTKELNLAMTVQRQLVKTHGPRSPHRRFVIPVAKDDLPTSDYNVHFVGGTNVLPFQSWANGFYSLRSVLKQDRTPRFKQNKPAVVKDWWNSYRSISQGRITQKHKVASNFFPFVAEPESLLIHQLDSETPVDADTPFPVYQNGTQLFAFAAKGDLHDKLGPKTTIINTDRIALRQLLSRSCPSTLQRFRPDLAALVRVTWEFCLEKRPDIRFYEMANGRHAAYFARPVDSDSLTHSFNLAHGFKGRRRLVASFGGGTRKDGTLAPKHFYHFAVDARPVLSPFGLQLISHVIFTDGNAPWQSKTRMHTVRRSFCAQWYNDRWRDCLFAWLSHLAQDKAVVPLSVSADADLSLRALPRLYTSLTLFEKIATHKPEDSEVQLSEEDAIASDLLDNDPSIEDEHDDEDEEP